MTRSRQRKKKRQRAAKEAADQLARLASATPEDARLVHRAVKENWSGVDHWNLRETERQVQQEIELGGATIDSKTRLSVLKDLDSEDPAVRNYARKSAIAMKDHNNKHALNQRRLSQPRETDDLPPIAPVNVNVQVNNGSPLPGPDSGVVIIQREDFFKNRAHERQAAARLTETNGSSVADSGVDGTVQNADLRSQVGENDRRPNGHHHGSRSNGNGKAGAIGSH